MKIYINNINNDDLNLNNILDYLYKKKIKQDIFSDDGIFYINDNKLIKINIIDKELETINCNKFILLKDKSIIKKDYNNYQIPFNNKIITYLKYYYKVNNNISFIIHCENNKITDFYFKSKYDVNNYDEIISFLSLLK